MCPTHRYLLRLEGAAILIAAVWAYAALDAPWALFAALLLVPDLSMLGYLAEPRIGAHSYNAVHTYLFPAVLATIGATTGWALALPLALIAVAHIGMDRALGYGLKHPSGFHDTHLSAPKMETQPPASRKAMVTKQ